MHTGVEHRLETLGDAHPGPRSARTETVQPHDHRRPHHLDGQRLTDRRGPAAQRAQRELGSAPAVNRLDHARAQARGHAVHRLAPGGERADHILGGLHAGHRLGGELHLGTVTGHPQQPGRIELAPGDANGPLHSGDNTGGIWRGPPRPGLGAEWSEPLPSGRTTIAGT
jgi:hypothetical protein